MESVVANPGATDLQSEDVMMADFESELESANDKIQEDLEMVSVTASGEIEMVISDASNSGRTLEKDEDTKGTTRSDTDTRVNPESSSSSVNTEVKSEDEKKSAIAKLDVEGKEKATDGEEMQVDFADVDEKNLPQIAKAIKRMGKKELEGLVMAKIVEALVVHSEVGKLRSKVTELQLQKDKMASKIGVMSKQVTELSKAVSTMVENESRDPKYRTKQHIIKFNRSVGLQTVIEPSVRCAPPKIIRVDNPTPNNGVKQYGASTGKQTGYASGQNGISGQAQGVKRVYQGSKTADSSNKVIVSNAPGTSATPSPRKVYSGAPPTRIAPRPNHGVTVTPVPPQQPGIVDLTDDDPPSQGAVPAVGTTTGGSAQQKVIVTPTAGQPRPVMLGQIQTGGNQVIVRSSPQNPVAIIQRPGVGPRPAGNATGPARVAATIPSKPTNNLVPNSANNIQKRFVLPAYPPTPPHKTKNDLLKPPPKPDLTLNEQADGIVLSWNLPTMNNMAEVTTYQIFACQESFAAANQRPTQWKRVGDVKALPLPMACTLSQFTDENRYHFIVRGIDVYGRVGPFCDAQNILLRKKKLN